MKVVWKEIVKTFLIQIAKIWEKVNLSVANYT